MIPAEPLDLLSGADRPRFSDTEMRRRGALLDDALSATEVTRQYNRFLP